MWWPSNLVMVSLFRYSFWCNVHLSSNDYFCSLSILLTKNHNNCRAQHEKEKRQKSGTDLNQLFLLILISSFAYYVLLGYLFSTLTSFSWVCWLAPKSILVQQLDSGLHGLWMGTFRIDWATISSYVGGPLASPWFATASIAVGFFLVIYVMTLLTYWFDVYKLKTSPFILVNFSSQMVNHMTFWALLIPCFI